MCESQTLSFNNNGYILLCKHCGNYQVAFMTTVLTFSEEEFDVFVKQVRFRFGKKECVNSKYAKSIVLHTASPIVCLILTRQELNHLNELVEECESELKVQEIISLFNQ